MAGQVMTTGGAIAPLVPGSFEDVQRMARMIVQSGFAPKDATEVMVSGAIMKGLEVGVPPMQAVQSIAVINGRPTVWGDLMLALVQRSPLCEDVNEWFEGEGDNLVAYCEAIRVGKPTSIKRSFSVQDAKDAGLWQTAARVKTKFQQKDGSYEKDNDSPWFRHKKRMLQMRARGRCLRDGFADVLAGLELREVAEDDFRTKDMRDVTPTERSNPLIDPPAADVLVVDEKAFLGEPTDESDALQQDDPQQAEVVAEQDQADDQQDDAVAPDAREPLHVGGFTIQPVSGDFVASDFVSFADKLVSITGIEGALGVSAEFKDRVDALSDDDKTIYRVAYGIRMGAIKGVSQPEQAASEIQAMREWVLA